jgi:NTP pyrophosphatase (non-canonical NTP hydrolase)
MTDSGHLMKVQCDRCGGWYQQDPKHAGYPDLHECNPDGQAGNRWAPMTLNDYQRAALRTAVYPHDNTKVWDLQAILYCALGLAGEAGEVANQVKKILRDDDGAVEMDRIFKIVDEMGDCLWYLATLSKECGFALADVGDLNVRKLSERANANTIHGDARNEK